MIVITPESGCNVTRLITYPRKFATSVMVVTHGGTLWMFRMLLERWTWDEAERQFNAGSVPQCSVTTYGFDEGAGRLVLQDLTKVYYPTGPAPSQ